MRWRRSFSKNMPKDPAVSREEWERALALFRRHSRSAHTICRPPCSRTDAHLPGQPASRIMERRVRDGNQVDSPPERLREALLHSIRLLRRRRPGPGIQKEATA